VSSPLLSRVLPSTDFNRHPASSSELLTPPCCPCRLHGHALEVYCGPNVITDRVALDKAGYTVDKQTFGPVGSALRFTNFTAHPSQTPGAAEHSPEYSEPRLLCPPGATKLPELCSVPICHPVLQV
jgi:hypothetical protein